MNTTVQSHTLDKVRVGVEGAISRQLLDARFTTFEDEFFPNQIRYQLRGFLWGNQVLHREIKHPLDWWQAFRARWFPAWWLHRWPVKERTEFIDLKAIYPTLLVLPPNHQPRLVLMVNSSIEGGYDELHD